MANGMIHNEFDIIVIGAGVAGGIFACSQKGKNIRILVIERNLSEQERIVGELLQPGGIAALKKLELTHLLDGFGAQKVHGYTLVNAKEHFSIPYPEIQEQTNGLGIRNGKFLLKIQEELRQQENVTLIEGSALNLIEENDTVVGVEYLDALINENKTAKAPLTIVCDGPLSRFRDKMSNVKKEMNGFFVGMILKDIEPLQEASGHIIVSGKAPVLVYPINENEWRILVDFPGTKAPSMGEKMQNFMKGEILDLLPDGMKNSFLMALELNDFKVMPNHNMKARAWRKEGVALLGDSLNMRHPLTGGGMTACFLDIILLNKELDKANMKNHTQVADAVMRYYKGRGKNVDTINILANALYKVVKDDDLKVAVFDYLKQGGNKAAGPLSLLAGLNKDKQSLLLHFVKVAIQKPADFFFKPGKQIRTLNKAVHIMYPLLLDESKPATTK
jgi:squalene monooxygenase